MPKQRYKIYDAERELPGVYFSSFEAAQGWLDWVCRTKWWKEHSTIRHIKLIYPTYFMSGATKLDDKNAEISVYAYSLDAITMCHELSHLVYWVPGNDQEKDHNPKFAGVYLAVVKRFMSKRWMERLQKEFEDYGVKWEEYS